MTISSPPEYRNTRPNFYTDKASDNNPVGSIINTFKAITDVYDNNYTPMNAYKVIAGNANTGANPEYQYPGYVYCDGSEYNISDFPALYEIIGTSYGGESRPGIKIVNGGSGYAAGTTITFSAAPTGGETIEGVLVIVAGVVTGVGLSKIGSGYTTEPTFTIANAGGGSGLQLEINLNDAGEVEAINESNVWEHWGESRSLGTFKVPDLKTRKIVGYGNVYGQGSPTVGLLSLGVGDAFKGGSWYFDKNSQRGFFALGTISTTDYDKVTDDVGTSVIGAQQIDITMQNRRLQNAPEHSHYILHTITDTSIATHQGYSGDRYLTSYTDRNSRTMNFTPLGGFQLEHKHGLVKNPITDPEVATYDILDWQGGASGTGSVKLMDPAKYYFASGAAGSGTWEQVTYTPDPLFRTFVGSVASKTGSEIGERKIVTGGTPVVEYTIDNTYTVDETIQFPTGDWEVMQVRMSGGGGSGSDGAAEGNDGEDVRLQVTGGSVLLDVTVSGGQGGGKGGNNYTNGGDGGTVTKTVGSNIMDIESEGSSDGGDGQSGSGPNGTFPGTGTAPSGAGTAGISLSGYGIDFTNGSAGKHTFVNTGSSSGPTVETVVPSDGLVTKTFSATGAGAEFTKIEIEVAGGQGADSQSNQVPTNTSWPVTGGAGGLGQKLIVEVPNVSSQTSYTWKAQAGMQGQDYAIYGTGGGPGGTWNTGDRYIGGPGGDGYSNGNGGWGGAGATDDGGGGGAVSVLMQVTNDVIVGAGGGGGAGGLQNDGSNSFNGTSGVVQTAGIEQQSSGGIYLGGGNAGGYYGCVGGGGGGGGAGASFSSSGGGGGSGYGGGSPGLGGPSGHGGGYGGVGGKSAVNISYVNYINGSVSNSGDGYVKFTVYQTQSYWSAGGGGGGSGAHVTFTVDQKDLAGSSSAQLTMNSTVASGVGGTQNAKPPYARVGFGVITGYVGATERDTIPDIIMEANDGSDLYASGAGTGAGGGFKLPTHQVPTVEFVGGGSGSGAAATVTVANGCVSGITLTNAGSGYQSAPYVRIKHGAGTMAYATVKAKTEGSKELYDLQLTATPGFVPAAYNTDKGYIKLSGNETERFCVVKEADCSAVRYFTIKVARGNGVNGGNTPEHSGDSLKLYYNLDMSLTFPPNNYLGEIVPYVTPEEVTSLYDGSGTGNEATKWYWYSIELPEAVKKPNVRFKIVQERSTGALVDEGDTDHYGICDFIYEKEEVTELKFFPTSGRMSDSVDKLTYLVEGPSNSFYPAGAIGEDATFTMTRQVPLIPDAAIDPDKNISLVEPYHLCKYLIKAF